MAQRYWPVSTIATRTNVTPASRLGRLSRMLAFLAMCAGPVLAQTSSDDPAVPPGRDPGGIAVAVIDTGVNYTLGEIRGRLARGDDGEILGRDFQDGDQRPFDLAPGGGPRKRHHGTSVATILLREAPGARLIPMRYKSRAPDSFAEIVEAIAGGPARIAAMPLGGYRVADWEPFRAAAAAHPEILFILSAGNDGRNIEDAPVYPAAFALDNAIVVTSTDAFGRLPLESNWGPGKVDISTPGERLATLDHLGRETRVSGSSFAVPRIAALAARLKAINPGWKAKEIKQAILALAGPSPGDHQRRSKYGWIANPTRAARNTP